MVNVLGDLTHKVYVDLVGEPLTVAVNILTPDWYDIDEMPSNLWPKRKKKVLV